MREFNQITFHALVPINKNISSGFTCTVAVHYKDSNSASYGEVTGLYALQTFIVRTDYYVNGQNWTFRTQ